jgi:hypothetical protein
MARTPRAYTVEVWRVPDWDLWHSYPWRAAVDIQGRRFTLAGVPNYCGTRHQAFCRAHVWGKRLLERLRSIGEISTAVRRRSYSEHPWPCPRP